MNKLTFNSKFGGLEIDWIGSDNTGRIGLFSTAGYGPIPVSILDCDAELDGLFEKLLAFPILGEPSYTAKLSHNIEDWVSISQRGIFAYDWRRESGRFELIAAPTVPIFGKDIVNPGLEKLLILVRLATSMESLSEVSPESLDRILE